VTLRTMAEVKARLTYGPFIDDGYHGQHSTIVQRIAPILDDGRIAYIIPQIASIFIADMRKKAVEQLLVFRRHRPELYHHSIFQCDDFSIVDDLFV